MKHKIFFLLLTSIFFLIGCSNNGDKIDSYIGFDIPKDTIDIYLEQKMKALKIPGMSIAIINEGEIVFQNTYGFANVEEKLPVTRKTIFEGASISKSVFAFFAMNYVEEGKLDLDKPLYEYLPYLDIAHDERYKKITARMVLSHRSGFPNWRKDEEDGRLKIKFEPGTDYAYSGEGYQYLAMVLKHIEGTDWNGLEKAFQDKVARPMGMEHTVFIQTPYTMAHKAEPYDANGKWIDWKNDYWYQNNKDKFVAAASIHTEPIDFSKWMMSVMNEELLSKESYEELLKPHSEVPGKEIDILYTLGFFKYPFPITNAYGHGGDNEGFTCFFTLNTKKDWGYVLFTNSEYGQQFGEELLFYLMAGPHLTKVYIALGIVLLTTTLLIVFGFKFIIRKIKQRKHNKVYGV